MKIKSFSINNFGNPCYVTCLPVMDILDRMVVDEWSPENRFGYQRVLDPRRVGGGRLSLLKSIESGITTPSNIVVNTREKLVFEEDSVSGNIGFGYLDIPDFVKFWVVDGRHKLEAYRSLSENDPKFMSNVLNLVIFDADDIGFEINLFLTLNTSHLKLNNGIVYRNIQNLGRYYGEEYILKSLGLDEVITFRAIELMELLNSVDESPFKGRILYYGTQKKSEMLRLSLR